MIEVSQTFRDFRTQKDVKVRIQIDEQALLAFMRYRALRAPGGVSKTAGGTVTCEVVK